MAWSLLAVCCLWVLSPIAAAVPSDDAWVPTLPLEPPGYTTLSLFPSGTGYAYHTFGWGGSSPLLFRTEDFGATWTPRVTPDHRFIAQLRMGTETTGYLASWGGELYRTEDGGWTWMRLPGIDEFRPNYEALATTADGRNVILSAWFGHPWVPGDVGRALFLSSDFGATWERVDLPADLSVEKIFHYDDDHAVALAVEFEPVGEDGLAWATGDRVLITHDGWRTYEVIFDDCPRHPIPDFPIFPGNLGYQGCQAVSMASPSSLVVGRNDGWTFISNDGGASWERGQRLIAPMEEPEDRGLTTSQLAAVRGLDFVDEHTGFALSGGGALWRTDDGGGTWDRETSVQVIGQANGELAAVVGGRAIAAGPNFVHARLMRPSP